MTERTDMAPATRTTIHVVAAALVQLYEFHDAEDGETYLWNATEGRRLAEARSAQIVSVRLSDMGMTPTRILAITPDLDQRKARGLPGVALLSPLLFVPHRGRHVLIDGWHRIYRAAIDGFPCLPAYVLTQDEAAMIRVSTTEMTETEEDREEQRRDG